MRKSKWLSVLLAGTLLAASIGFSTFSSAAEDEYVLLSGEEGETGVSIPVGGTDALTEDQKDNLDSEDKKAGDSSLVVSPEPNAHYFDVVRTFDQPLDISADAADWAVELWLYVDDIDKLDLSRDPQLNLRSNDGTPADNQKVFWQLAGYVNAGLIKDGWNQLILYVGSAIQDHQLSASHKFPDANLEALTQFRLYMFEKADVESPLIVKVDDVRLTKNPTKRSDGVLLDGSWYNPETNVNFAGIADQLSETTPEGKPCLSYKGNNGTPVGYWPITVPGVGIYDLGDVTGKQIEAQLYIDETLSEDEILDLYGECRIDLSSDGDATRDAYNIWLLGVKDDEEVINLKPGWNTIRIPFDSPYVTTIGNPDPRNINYLRPYCIAAGVREISFKIGYIKVTDIPRETTTVTSNSEAVAVSGDRITVTEEMTIEEMVNALVLEEKTELKLYGKDGAEIDAAAEKAESAGLVSKIAAFDTDTGAKLAEFTVVFDLDGGEDSSGGAGTPGGNDSSSEPDGSGDGKDDTEIPPTGESSAAAAVLCAAAAAGVLTVLSRRRRA